MSYHVATKLRYPLRDARSGRAEARSRTRLDTAQYRPDASVGRSQEVPHSDSYYSLNVLLGFARNPEIVAGEPYDLEAIFEASSCLTLLQQARNYAFGMALWAGAELGFDVPANVLAKVRDLRPIQAPRFAGRHRTSD
jgi:hypothetical protein